MKELIRLLVVEDEVAIRDVIRFSLPEEFLIDEAENINKAKSCLASTQIDLILLDWMLPGCSGIDFIKWLKQQKIYANIPIIMLTARAEEENKVKGLLSGADDYVTKPFSIDELIARIRTVLRRGIVVSPDNIITNHCISINQSKNEVKIKDNLINLTPNEFSLLRFLMKNPNQTFSREQLIDHIWGHDVYIDDRSVDAQVKRLREKLKPFACEKMIKTIRSIGYQFEKS